MQIKKVKFNPDETIISYSKQTEEEQTNKFEISSPEKPLPAFIQSLKDLKEEFCIINELDISLTAEPEENELEKLIITGVTFSHKNTEEYKVSILGYKKVELSNAPLAINSPVITLGLLNEDDEHYNFKNNLKTKLAVVMELAEKYVNGEREKSEQDTLGFGEEK